MSNNKIILVEKLKLDLSNFRTMPQPDESHAVRAMTSITPERFWALMDSLLDSGYLPTENILILRDTKESQNLIVKEGNRRIAALKIILGLLTDDDINVPRHLKERISGISADWIKQNKAVPCVTYDSIDASVVDKIVTLAHGKGEKAGRDQWNAVARARHNRDVNKQSEPALDLLEKYLKNGKNLTPEQVERWSGDYPLTVLDDAIKRVASRLGASSASDLAKNYPVVQHREGLDSILLDIGFQDIRFKTIRNDNDFATKYGIPSVTDKSSVDASEAIVGDVPSKNSNSSTPVADDTVKSQGQKPQGVNVASSTTQTNKNKNQAKDSAVNGRDPKSVKRILNNFSPVGEKREKVVALRDEAKLLSIEKTPLAFCFLLRSMFEISAKAYCADHQAVGGPSHLKSDGTDKNLKDVLDDIYKHMKDTTGSQDKQIAKVMHGAITELARPTGLLSVTSMNQLVHNTTFSVVPGDIAIIFGNIFPLLEAMNS